MDFGFPVTICVFIHVSANMKVSLITHGHFSGKTGTVRCKLQKSTYRIEVDFVYHFHLILE